MPATPLPPLLQGRRVRLRPFTAADITDTYLAWLNDPEVVRYSNQRFVRHTRESCERYFASFDGPAGSANLFVSLRVAKPDASERGEIPVGTLTAYRSLPHGTADVGILLGERAVWGQGIGLEAWRLLTDWLLTTPGLRKLTAGTLACNRAMLTVAERSGMQREGVRRAQEMIDGVPTDIVQFARFAQPAAAVAADAVQSQSLIADASVSSASSASSTSSASSAAPANGRACAAPAAEPAHVA
ncbi:MAG: GNAT family N-acetyltransferase [Burkholderiales bacterium]|nr:GNAT family N-acetyltransferase [Burkholderiales bacterium]